MRKSGTVLAIVIIFLLGGLSWFMFTRGGGSAKSIDTKSALPIHYESEVTEVRHPEFGIYDGRAFDDGLRNPVSREELNLDEYGEGIAYIEIYAMNIDGKSLKIIKSRYENGTNHFYYEYNIELDGTNITPKNFRTVESADCSLQKFRFVTIPFFQAIKISRGWEESWINPTMAYKTVYNLIGGQLRPEPSAPLQKICNVAELF